MKTKLFILLITIPVLGFSQSKEIWNLDCANLNTQLEINLCSYQSFKNADSILNHTYQALINCMDSTLMFEKQHVENADDHIQIQVVEQIENQISTAKQSQMDFLKFRDSTIEIIKLQYEGGSMTSFATNSYAIKLTESQIIILEALILEVRF
jgi:uncharacterized protein YecT (DUF1311 family)